jgi:ABC-type polysaccharide/polyol phosphate export permease
MWHHLAQLLKYRGLIQSLVSRELKARYRGSALGIFWSFRQPAAPAADLHARFQLLSEADDDLQPYTLFLCCGLLPWTWFSASLNEASGSLVSGGNLIKKVLFPAEVLPIVSVLANMAHFLLALPILAGFLGYYALRGSGGGSRRAARGAAHGGAHLAAARRAGAARAHHRTRAGGGGVDRTLPRRARHPGESADVLVLRDAIIYSWRAASRLKWVLDLNPFTHLAVSYQEILFHPENAFGHIWWLLALAGHRSSYSLAGTGSSTACAIHSRRWCEHSSGTLRTGAGH